MRRKHQPTAEQIAQHRAWSDRMFGARPTNKPHRPELGTVIPFERLELHDINDIVADIRVNNNIGGLDG